MRLEDKEVCKTKGDAFRIIDELMIHITECKPFVRADELLYLNLCFDQLRKMKKTIQSDKFFNKYFKDKTREEIHRWIDKESFKWARGGV